MPTQVRKSSQREPAEPQVSRPGVVFTSRDRFLMNNKLYQLWRFIVLNVKILKAVDHSKRS